MIGMFSLLPRLPAFLMPVLLRLPLPAGLALAALLFSGCGYTLGFRAPPGAKTIAVPIFNNATFPLRREVEFELTSAFRQEIQARTGLVLIDETANPDLVVRGRIVDFRERVVAEGNRDQKTESQVLALVELQIENYRDGTRRIEAVNHLEPFSIVSGESFNTGRDRAVRILAEKLVVALEDWTGPPPEPQEEEDAPSRDGG